MEPLILWCTPYMVGGVTAFAANLQMVTGWPMVRLSKRSTKPAKKIPGWPVEYHLRTLEELIDDPRPLILAGGSWVHEEAVWHRLDKRKEGVYWVFHDPTEFKTMPHTRAFDPMLCVVLRQANLRHQPMATLLPQPYAPSYADTSVLLRYRHAVSTARVDAMKQSHLLVEANRRISDEKKILLSGSPNRMYVYGKKVKYPELLNLHSRPPGFGSGAALCRTAEYSVDMTRIVGDGGGLQYTTLEAIDAGAVPVVWNEWLAHPGPMHDLKVLSVASSAELAALLNQTIDNTLLEAFRLHNKRYLQKRHAPAILKAVYNNLFA